MELFLVQKQCGDFFWSCFLSDISVSVVVSNGRNSLLWNLWSADVGIRDFPGKKTNILGMGCFDTFVKSKG